jgi:hypothetical protein
MVDLLPREQLLALGRLNLGFMFLDEMVSNALCDLLQCSDRAIADQIVAPLSFSARIDRIKALTKHHASGHSVEGSVLTSVNAAVSEAKTISENRNRLVHARLHIDESGSCLKAAKTSARLDSEPEQIDRLSTRAWAAALGLGAAMREFMDCIEQESTSDIKQD